MKYLLSAIGILLFATVGVYRFPENKKAVFETVSAIVPLSIEQVEQPDYKGYELIQKTDVNNNAVNMPLSGLAPENMVSIKKEDGAEVLKQRGMEHNPPKNKLTASFLQIVFDNDIFDNTDYYYTNGARLELVSPFAQRLPTSKLLPTFWNADISFQGLSLVQNIYTPVNPDTKEIRINDRPFSAYLSLGHFRESYNYERGLRMWSEISIGVLGPASMGDYVQSSIHDIEPVGWQNQIENDIVFNYSFLIEKLLLSRKNIEMKVNANAHIGTIYDKAGGGLTFRFGRFKKLLENSVIAYRPNGRPQVSFWFFTKVNASLIGYDATLQGGMFNKSSIYIIDNKMVKRTVLNASAGLSLFYRGFGIEIENVYVSPEFEGAYDFRYGRIKLVFGL
ncbi:MAG: lipid A deacylase LpxR family protein [Chlorobi bacterium]|nr:lipid A deacylase LpxR family protein [Chlorobiota bacterium]